jgi:hypothetical protein
MLYMFIESDFDRLIKENPQIVRVPTCEGKH